MGYRGRFLILSSCLFVLCGIRAANAEQPKTPAAAIKDECPPVSSTTKEISVERFRQFNSSAAEDENAKGRAVPYFMDAKIVGVRFFALRRTSLLKEIGFCNGDIVLNVNGQTTDDANAIWAAVFPPNLTADKIVSAQIQRNGIEATISYKLTN